MYMEEEALADERVEFRYDKSTRVPRKELDALLSEVITAYDLDEVNTTLFINKLSFN